MNGCRSTVLNGVAVSYLADDAPQRVALEHCFAMWVAGLAEPPCTVVLVVHGRAVGQVRDHSLYTCVSELWLVI